MAASDLTQKILNLQNEDFRFVTLQEMKEALLAIPRDELLRTAPSLELPLVFDCLNDSNTQQVDLACEVLSLCMNNLSLGESTVKYGVFLERALNHPHSAVKLMVLKEIERNVGADQDLCKKESLLEGLIRCVGDIDLGVAKKAGEIITTIGLTKLGVKKITSPSILKIIHEVMSVNEVIRLRVYEIIINIASKSENYFNDLKTTGIFEQILLELDNQDVLLRLNILELLTQLGVTKHGYSFLENRGILEKLSKLFDSDDTLGLQLCEPGILKFFGSMAHWKPMLMLSKHPKLFERLFINLESSDITILGVSLDTLGHIASVNEGKIALDSMGDKVPAAVKLMGNCLGTFPTEIKIRVLNCLEGLIRIVEPNNQVSQIVLKWFPLIDDDPVTFIWNYARNPFVDLKLAALGVLGAVAGHAWGQEAIKNTAGLVEFLMDRNIESVKVCKEAKFAIVEVLALSPVFDEMMRKRLTAHICEGPFYVQTITEVAVEGNE